MTPKTPRFWPEMKTRGDFARRGRGTPCRHRPARSDSRKCLGAVPQGVTVVWIVGHCPGLQHEQAAGSPAVVGDDRGLHAELVTRGGIAFADALHLRGMEGIKLPATLARLLRA